MQEDNRKNTSASEPGRVNAMTDAQLAAEMQTRWEQDDYPRAAWNNGQQASLWQRILQETQAGSAAPAAKPRTMRLGSVLRWAAAILLPVLLLTTGWLLYLQRSYEPALATVETGLGEKATVNLPDGTCVRMNYNTRLSYDPVAFQRSARSVTIDGEAVFRVAKDASRPFTVNATGVRVSVLGTVFNLRARADERRATVLLEEGSVSLCSTASGELATLQPVQKATVDLRTNSITVVNATKNDASTAWQRGELKFENEPLGVVLATIEGNYGVKFVNKSASTMLRDRFSGTLPSADLNEALDILEHTYRVDFSVRNKKITVSRR